MSHSRQKVNESMGMILHWNNVRMSDGNEYG